VNAASREGTRAAVVVVSTSAAAGTAGDTTGPVIAAWLRARGFVPGDPMIVSDGDAVGSCLRTLIADDLAVILTTGGTGVSPSDATPEQTAPVLDLQLPGLGEELRRRGAETAPTALLTRGLAGFAGQTLIVNLPGSPGGVRDGLDVLAPVLDHLVDQRRGHAAHATGRNE